MRLHNPAYAPTRAVATQEPDLYPHIWESDRGQALLLVTNMADEAGSGTVELDLGELDLSTGASVTPLPIEGTFREVSVDGTTIRLTGIPPLAFSAFLLG